MNLIILFENDFIGGLERVRLCGRRRAHICSVQRAAVGDRLRVGVLNGGLGTGRITSLAGDAVEMDVTFDQLPPASLPVTLLLALPRPKSLKRLLQGVAAMGVKHIVLINAWRVEKSFWESSVLQPETLREQLLLGLEQACDTILPEIMLRPRFKPFVEDEVPELIRTTRALLAHPPARQPCPRGVQEPVTLAVGPEGGFIPYEVEVLHAQGFAAVSLGERILRVEHAVPALLGRLY